MKSWQWKRIESKMRLSGCSDNSSVKPFSLWGIDRMGTLVALKNSFKVTDAKGGNAAPSIGLACFK
jgi:hypothetical protein